MRTASVDDVRDDFLGWKVVLCSGTRSEAEGKDSRTFLCAAFEREPHLSKTVSISGPESVVYLS